MKTPPFRKVRKVKEKKKKKKKINICKFRAEFHFDKTRFMLHYSFFLHRFISMPFLFDNLILIKSEKKDLNSSYKKNTSKFSFTIYQWRDNNKKTREELSERFRGFA